MSKLLLLVFVLFIALLTLTLAAFNMNTVSLDLYFIRTEWPLFVVMLVFFSAGILMALLLLSGAYWWMRGRLKSTQKQLSVMEQEVQNLRNIPIKDRH